MEKAVKIGGRLDTFATISTAVDDFAAEADKMLWKRIRAPGGTLSASAPRMEHLAIIGPWRPPW